MSNPILTKIVANQLIEHIRRCLLITPNQSYKCKYYTVFLKEDNIMIKMNNDNEEYNLMSDQFDNKFRGEVVMAMIK